MERIRRLAAQCFPWAIALVLASRVHQLSSGLPTVVGLLVGGVIAGVGLVAARRRFGAPATLALALLAGAVAWFALTSALSTSPVTGLLGQPGKHHGTALWMLGAVWLLAGMLVADARALRVTAIVTSVAGAFFTAAAAVEAGTGPAREQGYAAGFYANSSSLGSFLAVAVVASIIWLLVSRTRIAKSGAGFFGLVSVAGLVLSSSRTGFLAILLTLAFAALVAFTPSSRARTAGLSIGVPVFVASVTAVLVAASSGTLGSAARRAVAVVGTDRDVIWRSALEQLRQAPLLGSGLDQFTAVLQWTVGEQSLLARFASDPHSVPLAIVLGGGMVAGVLVAAAFAALLWALIRVRDTSPGSLGLSLLAAMPLVLLGQGLVNWIAATAMIPAFALTGAALGLVGVRDDSEDASPAWTVPVVKAIGGLTVVGALLLGALGVASLAPETVYTATYPHPFTKTLKDPRTFSTSVDLMNAYESWPDPLFVRQALRGMTTPVWTGDPEAVALAERALAKTQDDATWSADLALNQMLIAEALEKGDRTKLFDRYSAIAERGAQADPATGLWDALVAREAANLGVGRQAEYASQALRYPLDDETRALMERLAEE